MKRRIKCHWCGGEILRDDERKTIGHSVPVCADFEAVMRDGPRADRVTLDVIDDDDNVVASYPKR